ncbi:hypothetical protein [Catenuloplanes japonicus]|uniref:hypothetical protein n=1 Tax=Catenuloplanes japonicus TaxID=33876 RepID=UPI000691DA85|nr:hypothetical protein [Catenuloplanes japonicus]
MITIPCLLLVRLDQHEVRHVAILVIMVLTVAVAAPFGLAAAAVLPREPEGTLILMLVVTLQMMIGPAAAVLVQPGDRRLRARPGGCGAPRPAACRTGWRRRPC